MLAVCLGLLKSLLLVDVEVLTCAKYVLMPQVLAPFVPIVQTAVVLLRGEILQILLMTNIVSVVGASAPSTTAATRFYFPASFRVNAVTAIVSRAGGNLWCPVSLFFYRRSPARGLIDVSHSE